MNSFTKALQTKIADLEKDKEHIDDKIELLNELLESESEEVGGPEQVVAPKKRKAGRPKGSTNRKKNVPASAHAVDDDLYQEAVQNVKGEGTSKEFQQERIAKFHPHARPSRELGPGIVAGTKKQVLEGNKKGPDSTISIEDDE